MDEETITVPQWKYLRLREDSKILAALMAGGVENWDWYEESLEAADIDFDEETTDG